MLLSVPEPAITYRVAENSAQFSAAVAACWWQCSTGLQNGAPAQRSRVSACFVPSSSRIRLSKYPAGMLHIMAAAHAASELEGLVNGARDVIDVLPGVAPGVVDTWMHRIVWFRMSVHQVPLQVSGSQNRTRDVLAGARRCSRRFATLLNNFRVVELAD